MLLHCDNQSEFVASLNAGKGEDGSVLFFVFFAFFEGFEAVENLSRGLLRGFEVFEVNVCESFEKKKEIRTLLNPVN